ncbi:hypothetical protein CF15_01180 [Pyrodictium occultum]|uniref:DUF58 domain-containing protein n=1 Tax=Pyrodictium occultum TaxID=2309 RepID=A0A0V8RU13_PYROC|nr:DUF58 domain-containing protein [Pyrodictium occultum]KSW11491.1 hypothetical protein CF15_01180 [Pyrodictium occultum]
MPGESPLEKIAAEAAPLTPRGHAALFLSAALVAAGLLAGPGAAEALVAAGLALLALVLAERSLFLAKAAALQRLGVRWELETPMAEGRPSRVRLVLENRSLVALEHVEVYDSPPRLFRWREPPRAVVSLPALGRAVVEYTLVPVVGRHGWGGPLRLAAEDFLGFFRAERLVYEGLPEVAVQPRVLEALLRRALLPTVLQPGGVERLRRRGLGVEFLELREYTPDDDIRLVDWKASARRGRLVVKVFEQESSLRVLLVIDAWPSMFTGVLGRTRIEHAARLAATLAEYLARRGDAYRLYILGPDGGSSLSPWLRGRGSGATARRFIAERLSWPRGRLGAPDPGSRASALRNGLLSALPRGGAALILVSDLGGDPGAARAYAGALAGLRPALRGLRVYLVHLSPVLFESTALEGSRASAYLLLSLERLRALRSALSLLRGGGVEVVELGPRDPVSALLDRLERLRGVVS